MYRFQWYNRPLKELPSTSVGKTMDHNGSTATVWVPESDAERKAIREQLERILANPLFTHSKRYPSLLRYVVEHALKGETRQLKERSLGVEVFDRDPSYDTNLDPVVRMTAGEIRKRIAQYYHEAGHEHEIRIDLPSGSYVPEFRHPSEKSLVEPAQPLASVVVPSARLRPAYFVAAATVIVIAAVVSAAWLKPWAPPTASQRFWRPIFNSGGAVLLCIGQPSSLAVSPGMPAEPVLQRTAEPLTVQDLHLLGNQHVSLGDATTLSRIAGLLQVNGRAHHIQGSTSTTFANLREGPVVLIGAFNNEWTLRLTGQLRYGFSRDPKRPELSWISDRENPGKTDWTVDFSLPYLKLTEDYAIITRVWDPTTEQFAVVAAGIAKYGTIAAGEFLADSASMEALARQAPPDWDRKNMQVVIATKVIGATSGPPRVLATVFW
jgi:hypothetical protein